MKLVLVTFISLLVSLPLYAQDTYPEFERGLKLSPPQKMRAEQIRRRYLGEMRSLQQESLNRRMELRELRRDSARDRKRMHRLRREIYDIEASREIFTISTGMILKKLWTSGNRSVSTASAIKSTGGVYAASGQRVMSGRKTIFFPSLLIAVFLILVVVTGYFQVHIIQRNINDLFRKEGEILFKNIDREISQSLEYLSFLDQSGYILTPGLLNILAYDEAIVEYLYGLVKASSGRPIEKIPVKNILIIDSQGNIIEEKGNITLPKDLIASVISGKKETVIRMPDSEKRSMLMGTRAGKNAIFLLVDRQDLESLRKMFIIKEILETEGRRFDVVDLSIHDAKGNTFVSSGGNTEAKDVFIYTGQLSTKHLSGYRMEIHISKKPASEILNKTVVNFFTLLTFLIVAGGFSTYAIFLVQRKYEKKVYEMERQIELRERLVSLGRLASGMAHEIKNPLNAISLSIQRLKREYAPEPSKKAEYAQFLDIMRGELMRVDRIVNEFLLSARAQAPFIRENLRQVSDEVVLLLREKAESQRITINNLIDQEIVIECQRERIKQVFYNILLNGIEAIEKKGVIGISAEINDRKAEITVMDSGPGVRKELIQDIFEYYYTTKDKGMGLGLPVSYMIIKDHGGDIRVESNEGKGARFIITIPLVHSEETIATRGKNENLPGV